ncbi:MAG: YcjF family protein [Leptolyngbyaceae cyanobacterium]
MDWVLLVIQKLLSKRPILVGGVGLAAGLGLLTGLEGLFSDSTTLASLIAAGAGIWWWRSQRPDTEQGVLKPAGPVERETVEAALAALKSLLVSLEDELTAANLSLAEIDIAGLEAQRQALLKELDRTVLRVAIAGASRTGKSALITHLEAAFPLTASAADTTGLEPVEILLAAPVALPETITRLILQPDAILYLVTEDLTDSVLAELKALTTTGQRVLLCLNKQDQYLPDDRQAIVQRIKSRLQDLPQSIEVVAIATAPRPIKVRTHTSDGQIQERLEPQLPEVASLVQRLATWQAQETAHLVAQTVMRQTHQLRQDIQVAFNHVQHAQALPAVEQLQWTAAATAFASPLPSLDLLAAIAINGQLVMDLGRIYQQPLSLDHAKTIAAELAAVVVKLGLVEVSTQLLTTTLKSHAATYVVGGGVQAFSAAYLTRLSGESLMAYFEERALSGQSETTLSVDAIGQKLQTLLPRMQRAEFLQSLVRQGIQVLKPKAVALKPDTASSVEALTDIEKAVETEVVN